MVAMGIRPLKQGSPGHVNGLRARSPIPAHRLHSDVAGPTHTESTERDWMKRHAKLIVLWTAFLMFPMSVNAQITDYMGPLGDSEYLNFLNAGERVASTWTENGSRVYVGPYVGAFGQGVTDPQFSLICVDFENYAGDQQVNVTGLGSVGDDDGLGATRLGTASGSLLKYRQAAYLGSLFDEDWGTDRRSAWSAIHAAIWTIMTGDWVGGGELDYAGRNDFIAASELAVADGYSADGWYLLSAANGYNGQEMLIRTPASTVPEPSTYLLMATGLLFLVFFGRKRMRELEQA
jgi:hypothetical protein